MCSAFFSMNARNWKVESFFFSPETISCSLKIQLFLHSHIHSLSSAVCNYCLLSPWRRDHTPTNNWKCYENENERESFRFSQLLFTLLCICSIVNVLKLLLHVVCSECQAQKNIKATAAMQEREYLNTKKALHSVSDIFFESRVFDICQWIVCRTP